MSQPIVKFTRAFADAPPIRPAEKSAAGTAPAAAMQYCEALRRASSQGFYVYPPKDISLFFDGYEVFIHDDDDGWMPLKSYTLGDTFREGWNALAPSHLQDCDPPFVTELFVRGAVQVWSGYFIETAPGWSSHVRGTVNYGARSSLLHYEGIVDTDTFCPSPLFMNFQIVKTDSEIFISRERPLFQVVPVYRALDPTRPVPFEQTELFGEEAADFDWQGMGNTIRRAEDRDINRPGSYGAQQRKRAKARSKDSK